MKYIFFGTPKFAAIILEKLIENGMPPSVVVCNPDKLAGKKRILTKPLTKIIAEKHNIAIWQPESLKNYSSSHSKPTTNLLYRDYDFFIIAAYGKIIPKEILTIPHLSVIGIHPSLLPKYRGATPIQSAILNGEKETGATIFIVDERVDHGQIIANCKLQIANYDTYEILEQKLAELGVELLIETMPKFVNRKIKPKTQDETEATHTNKFTTQDGYVDPEVLRMAQNGASLEKVEMMDRKIRALNPEPGVWTTRDGKRVKLLEAEMIDGKLKLKKIQMEGKKPQIYRG